MAEKLTKGEIVALKWAASCNGDGIGFLGPSVADHGPVEEYSTLVSAGLLDLRLVGVHGPDRLRSGYWITDAGRAALANL